jgi:uncharacterized protein (DUF2384 family)
MDRIALQKNLASKYAFRVGASEKEAIEFMLRPLPEWNNQSPNQIIENYSDGYGDVLKIIDETYGGKHETI